MKQSKGEKLIELFEDNIKSWVGCVEDQDYEEEMYIKSKNALLNYVKTLENKINKQKNLLKILIDIAYNCENKMKNIIKKLFEKDYKYQGMIQFDENHTPCICGCSVKWLDNVSVKAFSEKEAEKKAEKLLCEKYSEYKNCIQLY